MAPLMIVLATILGGGSLCLFGLFLLLGPFELLPLGWTEPWALVWDSFLSLVFFAQHSTMLRPSFRDRLAEHLPTRYHGALYSITSGLALTGVVLLWQCSPTMLCRLDGLPRLVTRALFILAAGGMAWGASVLHSFDPLGLQAIRAHGRNRESPAPRLAIRGPYRWVRHPLYSFSIVMIWSHPDFSVDRLLFNLLWTAWIFGATYLEEADLAAVFGEPYREYQRRVPRLFPWHLPPAS